jgi:superfamily II DNA or RNA helicase
MSRGRVTLLCGGGLLAAAYEPAEPPGVGLAAPPPAAALPLPADFDAACRRHMGYTHIHHLRGADAYDPVTGEARPVLPERRELWRRDDFGRLTAPLGYLDFCVDAAARLGYQVRVDYTDGWTAHPRPGRFEPDWVALDATELRYRQREIFELSTRHDRACFVAPPGFGKSECFLRFALLYSQARIKVVVQGQDLVEQLHARLRKAVPHVGIVYGKEKRFDRVTVVSADSLGYVDFNDRAGSRGADVFLLDEAHRLVAPKYLEYLSHLRYAKVFGFTATPAGRSDGADPKLEAFFGPCVFHVPYPEAQAHGLVSPIEVEWLLADGPNPCRGVRSDVARDRRGLWRHERRNRLFAERVRAVPAAEQVLVLVNRVEHAVALKEFLPEARLVVGQAEAKELRRFAREGHLDEDDLRCLTPKGRRRLREEFEGGDLKRVVSTVWHTGIDNPALAVLVWAQGGSGRIAAYQGPGRVSRVDEGKPCGRVIDAWDAFDPGMEGRSRKRKRHYDEHHWTSLYDGKEGTPRATCRIRP